MATIKATDLATLLGTDIDSTYNTIVFDSSGNTYQVEFEAATHQANDNNGCICVKEASLTIPSADVLTLNSTPIDIVPAQGVGTAIEVISASVKIDFNTTAYATNTVIMLITDTATSQQSNANINATSNQIGKFRNTEVGSPSLTQLIENKALNVFVDTGNPTAGDSDITVYVTYRVITI
jgi:hypothetical protein